MPRTGVASDGTVRYRATQAECGACAPKPRRCPNTPARQVPRSIREGARDMARDIGRTDAYVSRRERNKVEMLFAHLKSIVGLERLRLRGPRGARDEFHLAATAQDFRLHAAALRATVLSLPSRGGLPESHIPVPGCEGWRRR